MTAEISFAGKVGYNIKDNDIKQRILTELQCSYNFKVFQKHFDKFDESTTLTKLQKHPHLVSVRTNGNPYLLYLTKINFVNQCIFIDKKVQQGYAYPRMILSRFKFDDSLFEYGTVIDGEMVLDNNKNWLFIISDLIGYEGHRLEREDVYNRINRIYDVLLHKFEPDPFVDACHFQVKKYFALHQIDPDVMNFVNALQQSHYSCRGLYFKPMMLNMRDTLMNFDDSLIKNVRRVRYNDGGFVTNEQLDASIGREESSTTSTSSIISTVRGEKNGCYRNYFVQKTGLQDVYVLTQTSSTPAPTSHKSNVAVVSSMKTSKLLRDLFENRNVADKVLMRCERAASHFEDIHDKWTPVSIVGQNG
jgi:hypothetical protein